MPTEKHRINVTVDDWLWNAIEDYRYEKRLMSKSQAATTLLDIGLRAEGYPVGEVAADMERAADRAQSEENAPATDADGAAR